MREEFGGAIRRSDRGQYETDLLKAADDAVALYHVCVQRARAAVMAWMIVAKKLGLYRDVARVVGQMVWEDKVLFHERVLQQSYSLLKRRRLRN